MGTRPAGARRPHPCRALEEATSRGRSRPTAFCDAARVASALAPLGRTRETTLPHAPTSLRWLAAGASLAVACTLVAAAAPPAPSEPVVDILHDVRVADPYRNLENLKSPSTQAWLKVKGEEAAALLARIDGREAMIKRIAELAAASGDA